MVIRTFYYIVGLLFTLAVQASPQIEHWLTDNGGRVFFVSAPDLPMLDVKVVFNAGSAQDKALPGTALLTNAMLSEGAAGKSSDEIAAAFEDVGANFGNSAKRDMAILSLRTLTDEHALNTSLQMMTTVLSEPDFPQAAFERLQKQVLLMLQAENQSPSAIASRAFYSSIYGKHPYGAMPVGNNEVVSNLNVKSLNHSPVCI